MIRVIIWDKIKNNIVLAVFIFLSVIISGGLLINYGIAKAADNSVKDYIKWLDFDVRLSSLEKALKYDIDSYQTETPLNWIELISYAAAKNWGNVKDEKKINKDIDDLVKKLKSGSTISELVENNKNMNLYGYYYETYNAVLNGFVGEYELVESGDIIKKYGLKVFSPIAKGYGYSHYDDFGNSRAYGYRRKHLGNDLLGSVGTPVIAVEDGYIEAIGWNQYGGWRIGIRSHDLKRYYYYAHLRKDHPFVKGFEGLKEGDCVQSGDVIGYLGMTGYSSKENTNNIKIPHLHFGLQIIFDEVQKDGVNQIWVDVYNIVNLLEKNRMPVEKYNGTDFKRVKKINNIVTD